MDRDPLFSPVTVANVELPNRIVLAPMTRTMATSDGVPTPEMARYYARYGRFGTGTVITEATYIDEEFSKAYFDQPGMANDAHAAGWRQVVEAVKSTGSVIILQLQHVGRLAEVGLHDRPLSPTDETPAGTTWQRDVPYGPVRAATTRELERIVDSFAAAASRAVDVGFDGVELHGSHGYLLDQFLSEDINRRDDEYGGDLTKRLRLAREVTAAVRAAIGDALLSYNYSFWKMGDYDYEPPGGEAEVAEVVSTIEGAGADVIHASTRRATKPVLGGDAPFGVMVKRYASVPVMAGGTLVTPDDAREVLEAGIGDLVVLGRAHAANPDWVQRALAGDDLASYVRGQERRVVDV